MTSKLCSKCKIIKKCDNFHKDLAKKSGLASYCKPCCVKKGKRLSSLYKKINVNKKNNITKIICSTCKKNYSIDVFDKNSNRKNGYNHRCNLCKKKYLDAVKARNKLSKIKENDVKKCYVCKGKKSIKNFHNDISRVGGLSNICKMCSSINDRANRSKRRLQARKRYHKCPEKLLKHIRKRRAMKKNVNENYTEKDAIITEKAFGNKCFKCKGKDNMCKDHHLALHNGNALSITNAVVLCRSCNSKKGTKGPKEFYSARELKKLDIIFNRIASGVYNG